MEQEPKTHVVLIADDDDEDALLVRDALAEVGIDHRVHHVVDGVELLDYLYGRGQFAEGPVHAPDLILLDLKMPRQDGRDVLERLKLDDRMRPIPIVVLTTSMAEDDIAFAYENGASSYVVKPTTFRGWIDMLRVLCDYWFKVVTLPTDEANGR